MRRLVFLPQLSETARHRCVGALLAAGLGLAVFWSRPGDSFDRFSYDAFYLLTERPIPPNVLLVRIDELSSRELRQSRTKEWDRGLHAGLLEKLRAGGAKLVVFDVFFTEPGDAITNALFARAIATNGNVILSGPLEDIFQPGFTGKGPQPPIEILRKAALGWGLTNLDPDNDGIVRRQFPGTDLDPSLAWAAAAAQGNATVADDRRQFFRRSRWLHYYGANGALPGLSYNDALDKPPEYFRDKVIFIGGKPRSLFQGEEADEFSTPLTRWTEQNVSGMDIHATALLNLQRGEWLTRWSKPVESIVLIVAGIAAGLGLTSFRARYVAPVAVVAMVAVAGLAQFTALHLGVWFGWATVVGLQIPIAGAWALVGRRVATPAVAAVPAAANQGEPTTKISGHQLLREIGHGAYGEVWLARDVTGRFHAVKIIHRRRFTNSEPFEREFRGIQKFTPISRSHPGFVHILHVDRDESAGSYYYIMEVGDDLITGQHIDPPSYEAKTLSKVLNQRGRLPLEECLSIGIALASALDHLHGHKLIHRDIKPSNIIFVDGVPKLADIGLVTDVQKENRSITYIGTEGYLAPEGPGTPAADVYSLGKVLYEAVMGCSRERFPELPSTLIDQPADLKPVLEMNNIVIQACAPDLTERYATAAELRAALVNLQQSLQRVPG